MTAQEYLQAIESIRQTYLAENAIDIKAGQRVKMKKSAYKGRIMEFTGDIFITHEGLITYQLQRIRGHAWMLYWTPDEFEVVK